MEPTFRLRYPGLTVQLVEVEVELLPGAYTYSSGPAIVPVWGGQKYRHCSGTRSYIYDSSSIVPVPALSKYVGDT